MPPGNQLQAQVWNYPTPATAPAHTAPLTGWRSPNVRSRPLLLTLVGWGLLIGLSFLLSVTPALANDGSLAPATAPIIVDGEPVLGVSRSENFTAEDRAAEINDRLARLLRSSEFIQATVPPVAEVKQLPNGAFTIEAELTDQDRSRSRYILTVTDRDAGAGLTPAEQAEDWAERFSRTLGEAYQRRRPQYLQRALIQVGGVLLAILIATWFIQKRGIPWVRSRSSPDNQDLDASKQLLVVALVSLNLALGLAALLYCTSLFPITRLWSYRITEPLRLTFTSKWLSIGDSSYSVVDLLVLFSLFWAWVICTSAVASLLRTRVLSLTGMTRGVQEVIAVVTRYLLIFVGTVVLLQIWGLDLSSLTLLGGALGVGIGFGLQDIARDFGSGLVLLFERAIQSGDFIQVDNYMGIVERVGARSIILRTLDHVSVIVPNSQFITSNVINWSYGNPLSRLRIEAPVAYGCDVETVRSCLLQVADEHPQVMKFPVPKVVFLGYGDNSLNFQLFVWISEPGSQLLVTSDLYFAMETLFRAHQVEIPFPQRDLHVRSGSLPI
ncbi:MAG: mechanosensitive ion channel domain-containing protein, partial [Cyanobacteria bacterium P01_H01_bin.121]